MRDKLSHFIIIIALLITFSVTANKGGVYYPVPMTFAGFDGDGVLDAADLDDDNDGIPDIIEDANLDMDGDPYTNPTDTDGDGIIDIHDLDSDGDGIFDIIEAGGTDIDQDGKVDGFTDVDSDGLDDAIAASPLPYPDSDGDGIPDTRDIDSDGDGIPDNIEGPASNMYLPPLGFDVDGDGIDDAYDPDQGGTAIVLQDTDMDSQYDYLDTDADNDGEEDLIEGWDTNGDGTPETTPSGFDNDGDGLDNAFDVDGASATNSGGGNNGGALPTDFPDEDIPGIGDLDWREFDNDADGISNYLDNDDDNDGIPDFVEVCGPLSTSFGCMSDPVLDDDNDGIINYRDPDYGPLNSQGVTAALDFDGDGVIDIFDLDSDNDGLSDAFEAGFEDADANGKIDDLYGDGTLVHDTDLDGWSDSLFTSDPRNVDNLTLPDYKDLDADNDGIYDIIENGGTDINNDGKVDSSLPDSTLVDDPENDGLSNTNMFTSVEDVDGDGYGNYTDLDSDNDGISDLVESNYTDVDTNGMIDSHTDANGDGADDVFMHEGIDTDGDGIPDYRDLDSDNDLIADVEEVGLVDLDADGALDAFTDANGDGWEDINFIMSPTNTDGTGAADFRSRDADGDGIYDIVEGGKLELDADLNGVVDGFTDIDGDGWHDTDHLSTNEVPNTDDSGPADYQDIDADGDGILDEIEWDVNGDGVAPDDCDDDGVPDWLDPDFCEVVVPQGFSPNNDGINDKFVLVGIGYYPDSKITIFNRWGEKVYESESYQNDWDGTNQFAKGDEEVLLPTGTYYFVFEPERLDSNGNEVEPTMGYVYLSR